MTILNLELKLFVDECWHERKRSGVKSWDLKHQGITSGDWNLATSWSKQYVPETKQNHRKGVIHNCYSTVTCKVFIESTSTLLNRPQQKLGQSCANSWHKIDQHATKWRACHIKPLFIHNLVINYLGKQDWDEISFQTQVPDLIQQIMEDRLRHARDPVQSWSQLHKYPQDLNIRLCY